MASEQPYSGKGTVVYKEEANVKNWALVINYGSDLFTSLVNAVSSMGLNVAYVNHKFCSDRILLELFSQYEFKAIILSGSARSVNEANPPKIHPALLNTGIPVLAICYSMEWIAHMFNVPVAINKTGKKEEGPKKLEILADSVLWRGLDRNHIHVHMFHLFEVTAVPEGFRHTARTEECEIAAFEKDNLYCVQFHPEYPYSTVGKIMLMNFFREVCKVPTFFY
jgi:GMP synthase (glutamine-hydrolysing)